jgi:hypothetical protein
MTYIIVGALLYMISWVGITILIKDTPVDDTQDKVLAVILYLIAPLFAALIVCIWIRCGLEEGL